MPRDGRSQDDASMLAELSSSDGAPSEAGAELQKLAEEHTLCLGPETHTHSGRDLERSYVQVWKMREHFSGYK